MPRHAYFPLTLFTLVWFVRLAHSPHASPIVLIGLPWFVVAVHELGHAAACWCLGSRVLQIIPTPFMGMTIHEEIDARRVGIVALAGPVAGALAGVAGLFAIEHGSLVPYAMYFLARFILWATIADNLVFNMLPLGTLDGAYVLRGLVAWREERAFGRRVSLELDEAWRTVHVMSGCHDERTRGATRGDERIPVPSDRV